MAHHETSYRNIPARQDDSGTVTIASPFKFFALGLSINHSTADIPVCGPPASCLALACLDQPPLNSHTTWPGLHSSFGDSKNSSC
ncbi:hypothetical protein BgiMline_013067 [Biomphalaria glabrata]